MNNVFDDKSFASVLENVDLIRDRVDQTGFALVRGVVEPETVDRIKRRVAERFRPGADVRRSGDYKRGSADFHRLDLGEYAASTRFARYFFFFPWNNDDVFTRVNDMQLELLNRLARKDGTFGSMTAGDSDASRFRVTFVLQYPTGGGFMSSHREHSKKEGDKNYVVYFALTTRGEEFSSGGAYVSVPETGAKLDLEASVRAGDLVIYRGDMFHGVDGVDTDLPVDLSRICGRMMVTTVVKYFADDEKTASAS